MKRTIRDSRSAHYEADEKGRSTAIERQSRDGLGPDDSDGEIVRTISRVLLVLTGLGLVLTTLSQVIDLAKVIKEAIRAF